MGWGNIVLKKDFSVETSPSGPLSFFDSIALNIVPAPEQKAVELMSRCLSPGELNEYLHTGKLLVAGQITGKTYQLGLRDGVVDIDGFGTPTSFYCIHSPHDDRLPPSDDVLAWYLLIKYDEQKFLNIANRRKAWRDEENWLGNPQQFITPSPPDIAELERLCAARGHQIFAPQKPFTRTLDHGSPDIAAFAYDYVPQNSMHQAMENWHLPEPALDRSRKYIIQGIAAYCLEVTHSQPQVPSHLGNMWGFGSSLGMNVIVRSLEWPHMRSFDNSFLFGLLAGYTKCLTERTHEGNPAVERPTKIIMSSNIYSTLFGCPRGEFIEQIYRDMMILVDDRVGDFIFTIPDARNLGVIPVGQRTRDYGIGILEPQNIRAYYHNLGRIHPVSEEFGIEALYGLFVEGDPLAIEHDIMVFELSNVVRNLGIDLSREADMPILQA